MVRQRRLITTEPSCLTTPAPASATRVITEKGSMTAESPSHPDDERRTLLGSDAAATDQPVTAAASASASAPSKMSLVRQNQWIVLAIASGACAAFNGVFAKLTTGDRTTSFAQAIAGVLHLGSAEVVVEYTVRAIFFGLNLVFNGVMWGLFTQALARGSSTTQVSIMNTSSNFFVTAIMGLIIFSESLPPLWWVGAALLVAGNVIIGKQDDGEKAEGGSGDAAASAGGLDGVGHYQDVPQEEGVTDHGLKNDEDEDIIQLGDLEVDD